MRTVKEVHVVNQETDRIICNMCGETINRNQFGYFDEHLSIKKEWGYGSAFDGEIHCFDLCESCYEKLREMMKIAPGRQPVDNESVPCGFNNR